MKFKPEEAGVSYRWIMAATGDERDRRIRIISNDRDRFATEWTARHQELEFEEEEIVNTESVNDR